MVEPVDRAIGKREMRDTVEKDGGDAMSGKIEGRDCGHEFEVLDETFDRS